MKYFLTPLILVATSATVFAKNSSEYSMTLEAGASHNSELVVEEIDQYSGSGDTARYLSLDLNANWTLFDNLNVDAGYNVSDTDYQASDDFDLTIHRFYGDVSYDFSAFTVGANQHEIDAKLNGDSFLDMSRNGLYLSKLFNDSVFIRAEMVDTDKSFDTNPDRDANNESLGIDTYFFFNQAKSFFSLGYSSDEETAKASQYSYDGDSYRATYSTKLGNQDKHRLQAQWRYFNRDYNDIYPEINTARNDSRHTYKLAWDYYFTQSVALATELQRNESESNFEPADYTSNEINLLFKLEL